MGGSEPVAPVENHYHVNANFEGNALVSKHEINGLVYDALADLIQDQRIEDIGAVN